MFLASLKTQKSGYSHKTSNIYMLSEISAETDIQRLHFSTRGLTSERRNYKYEMEGMITKNSMLFIGSLI